MKDEYMYLFQSTVYFREILKINRAFKKQKIDFLFLKGLPLHLYYEKSYPKRIYGDCDVLIAKKDYEKTIQILKKYGYKKVNDALTKKIIRTKGQEIELSYYKLINNVPVVFDIHLEIPITIVHLNNLDPLYPHKLVERLTKEFLQNKQHITINNHLFLILNTKYLILYLSIHFFQHNYHGSSRLELLDTILRKYGQHYMLINSIIRVIKEYRLQNFVYPSFFLLKKYFHTPLPDMFLNKIQPINSLTRRFIKTLINTNISDDESRIMEGMNRFKNLFFLSPEPFWKKLLTFGNPQILYALFWTIKARFNRQSSDRRLRFRERNTT